MPLKSTLFCAAVLGLISLPALAGPQMEAQLSDKDKARAATAIRKVLKERGFDDDAISAIVDSGEGYEPKYGYNMWETEKTRWFGFDPETGKQYPSDVSGFATTLNKCYSKLSPNKYSRQYNIDRYHLDYPDGNTDGPQPSDETFGYCNFRFDPATGCKLSELEGFRCRYFFHNEAGHGTCDSWGAGPMLAFDPGNEGYAKLQLEAPENKRVETAEATKPAKKKKTKSRGVAACKFTIDNAEELKRYLSQAKAAGYPD
jgi:hypothetical protein